MLVIALPYINPKLALQYATHGKASFSMCSTAKLIPGTVTLKLHPLNEREMNVMIIIMV